MKKLLILIIFFAFSATSFGQKITIDSSFGENGIQYFEDTLNLFYPVIEKDYKNRILILSLNVNNNFVDTTYSLYRYLETGQKDESFGTNGKKLIYINRDNFLQFQILPDNKIIMLELENSVDYGCQYIYKGPITIKRLFENGDIDTTYGDAGTLKIDLDSTIISHVNLTIQSDSMSLVYIDFITCAGSWTHPEPSNGAYIFRINSSGKIDSAYGTNGYIKLDSIGFSNYCGVKTAISNDNNIVLSSCYWNEEDIFSNILT